MRSPLHLPTWRVIQFGTSEPLLVLRASEDQIRYWFRWKLTPPFQVPSTTFLQPSWSLFQHIPLSAVLQYIFIILFTFIDLFHKVHSHHTFTFLSLPQFLASIVIFTDWGKQGVTIPSPLKEHHPRCSIYQHDMHVQM
jgi:hypothetical protein